MQQITVQKLFEMFQDDVPQKSIVIDVRAPGEYHSEHISFAKNIPLDQIKNHIEDLRQYEHVYVQSNTGNRSKEGCKQLETFGFQSLHNITGGISEWKKQGLPVVKGKGSISIMRQVQITAGVLALLGAILAHWNFNWIYLSGFIGAGLLFSGLSGTCAMATILGKMPWNK